MVPLTDQGHRGPVVMVTGRDDAFLCGECDCHIGECRDDPTGVIFAMRTERPTNPSPEWTAGFNAKQAAIADHSPEWVAGYNAKRSGKTLKDCPLDQRQQAGRDWVRGWFQAEPPEAEQ